MSYPIAVIGAGLSGLYASLQLARAGQQVLLIEARDRVGGRIMSPGTSPTAHRVDLGPSWFWPEMNPRVSTLVQELGLRRYAQHGDGAMLFEGPTGEQRMIANSWVHQPPAQRLQGGMQALVEALDARLGARVRRLLSTRVTRMRRVPQGVELTLADGLGTWTQRARAVIAALPPRLLAQGIQISPALGDATQQALEAVPTWMAGHAKFAAQYPTPFWRADGLSGMAFSQRGPLAEIHDASSLDGQSGALFGFFGLTPDYRAHHSAAELERLALAQLERLFGPRAAEPTQVWLQDWSREPLTATPADHLNLRHPDYQPIPVPPAWQGTLLLAGTEQSGPYGGLLEGALESAERAVARLLATAPGLSDFLPTEPGDTP